MISTGFFNASATRPGSTYTSLCGHKIWVSGPGFDGPGASVMGANLTLFVSDRCKCTGLKQPYDSK